MNKARKKLAVASLCKMKGLSQTGKAKARNVLRRQLHKIDRRLEGGKQKKDLLHKIFRHTATVQSAPDLPVPPLGLGTSFPQPVDTSVKQHIQPPVLSAAVDKPSR